MFLSLSNTNKHVIFIINPNILLKLRFSNIVENFILNKEMNTKDYTISKNGLKNPKKV